MSRNLLNWQSPNRLLFLLFLLASLLSDCRSPQKGEEKFSDIRSKILDFMEEENVPSVSVAVAQHHTIVWEESFGWANREKKIRATPNTMYELASIAKVFTTTGLMVLREKGLVDLDAPVEPYLGGVKIKAYGVDAAGVTLRRIVQHTSGLPMYWGEPFVSDSGAPFTQEEMFRRYAILAFPPGEQELYSNLGIAMITRVIEVVSGKPYADFLKDEVCLPLGMARTARVSAPAMTDEYAQQYTHGGEPWTYEEGLYASAHDLLRFGMFHLKNHLPDQQAILGDSSIDLMQTSIDPRSDFRLPWWVWEYDGFRALVFTGASGTIIALLPEADLAIVVLANRLQANTPRIARWIADAMLHDFDEATRKPTRVQRHEKTSPGRLSPESLTGFWKGSITTSEREIPVEISFSRAGPPEMRSMNNDGSWQNWVETMPSLRGDYSAGIFSAYFPIRVPVEDTRGHDHWTWVYAGIVGDTLRGYAVAHAGGGPHFGLPFYIRLVRSSSPI